jgi:hypothetical protein
VSTNRYSIRPIPTRYDGYSFRSRLEARWAVFYKALGLPYRYETEGYVVNGVKYLADFYFPTQEEKGLTACYVEIKPTEPTPEEEYKAEWLAQYTGVPVYLFYGGELRLPKEENGAYAKFYRVRDPWLSYQSWPLEDDSKQRVPSPLAVSNELRVVLLRLYEAGFQIQISHADRLSPAMQVLPRQGKTTATPEQIIQWLTQLKELQEELVGAYSERLRQFLTRRRGGECENDSPRSYSLACPFDEGADRCNLEECERQQALRRTMRVRLDEEKPLSLLIQFDESRSPDRQYWAMCTSYGCHAIGIFPGNIAHDVFCDLHCRDADDYPWSTLTTVDYKNEQEYLDACAKVISSDTEELRAAYLAARGESFDRKPTSK